MRLIDAVTTAEVIEKEFNIPLADLVDVFAEIPTIDIDKQTLIAKAKTEVAREIFAEIYKTTASVYNEYVRTTGSVRGMNYAFVINLEHAIDELKNKYTKEGVGE